MVDLKIGQTPTSLAPPAIPLQYLVAKSLVGFRIKPQPGSLLG
jgi:hypothetical protein